MKAITEAKESISVAMFKVKFESGEVWKEGVGSCMKKNYNFSQSRKN